MFELPPPRNVCSESKFHSFAKQKKSGLLDAVTAINFLEDAAPLHCTAPFSKSKIGQIENVQSARILCTQHVSKVKINIWSCPPPKKENEAHLNLDCNHSEILKIQTYGKTIGDTQIFHFHPSTGWIGILKPGETSNVQSSGCWPTSYRINQRNSRSRTWKCSKSLTWSQHNLANMHGYISKSYVHIKYVVAIYIIYVYVNLYTEIILSFSQLVRARLDFEQRCEQITLQGFATSRDYDQNGWHRVSYSLWSYAAHQQKCNILVLHASRCCHYHHCSN